MLISPQRAVYDPKQSSTQAVGFSRSGRSTFALTCRGAVRSSQLLACGSLRSGIADSTVPLAKSAPEQGLGVAGGAPTPELISSDILRWFDRNQQSERANRGRLTCCVGPDVQPLWQTREADGRRLPDRSHTHDDVHGQHPGA
jgi:hypothetical protein